MYSNIKSVQILISLLKEHGVKKIVFAPGGSDIPIIHSIEQDKDFECYSVVDERSLVYFAMGMSQEAKEAVACVCTSGTAVSNFLPGITEAFYQNVPLIAITADKSPQFLEQMETQKIEQRTIFKDVCKKIVDLPVVKTEQDFWLCGRLVNEVLCEMRHHGCGPVQINIPIVEDITRYEIESLPSIKKISYVMIDEYKTWKSKYEILKSKKKIMVLIGQNIYFSQSDTMILEDFFEQFNCFFAVEHLSNINCKGALFTYPATETNTGYFEEKYVPDLIISIGNNISSYRVKALLREYCQYTEHWSIDICGRIRDTYMCLSNVFECEPQMFFAKMLRLAHEDTANSKNDLLFYNVWKERIEGIQYPEFEYSNLYIAKKLAEIIPANSILHCAILNSTRIMQFFKLKENIKVYSNIGALGIDGCFSTFIGQACVTDKLAFLLIGDLSFFYDMNAAGIKHLNNNVRVILLNNSGASEFHFAVGSEKIETINEYISVKNQRRAEGWVKSLGFDYYAVQTKEELDVAFEHLSVSSDAPIFVEVFTDMEEDARLTKQFYLENYAGKAESKVKNLVKKCLSKGQYEKLQALYRVIRN